MCFNEVEYYLNICVATGVHWWCVPAYCSVGEQDLDMKRL